MKSIGMLVMFLGLAFAAAGLGAFFPPGDWYGGLVKPSWTPPSWLFGPVWTLLYVMIGVAGWRLWRARPESGRALAWWAVQMILNTLWSGIFFGLHAMGWALLEIAAMWLAIAATIATSWRVEALAARLLLPYLAWVTFATALNATLWWLN